LPSPARFLGKPLWGSSRWLTSKEGEPGGDKKTRKSAIKGVGQRIRIKSRALKRGRGKRLYRKRLLTSHILHKRGSKEKKELLFKNSSRSHESKEGWHAQRISRQKELGVLKSTWPTGHPAKNKKKKGGGGGYFRPDR